MLTQFSLSGFPVARAQDPHSVPQRTASHTHTPIFQVSKMDMGRMGRAKH